MDYQKILKISEEKLQEKFPKIIEEIKDCIISGSTGSEIVFRVGKYIKDLEHVNNEAYSIIKKDIEDYLNTCKKYGLIIL